MELYDKLTNYHNTDDYPFHMPGHKRQADDGFIPYGLDITEIDGFDNLHEPNDVIKRCLDKLTEFFESDRTYMLVNGSTGGILSAISACTQKYDKILIARNCHKSVYNAVYLNELHAEYVYPSIIPDCANLDYKPSDGVYSYGARSVTGGVSPNVILNKLEESPDIKMVIITSPTYEGIVSDVRSIAKICHERGIVLMVDEAHGAHFDMHDYFPNSALSMGADIVIQSTHKTLSSLTQTALLHVKSNLVEISEIEKYLKIYQTSSPSYVFMASLDRCYTEIIKEGTLLFETFVKRIKNFRINCEKLTHIGILSDKVKRKFSVYDYDKTRLVIFSKSSKITGPELYRRLQHKYHLVCEMAQMGYVVAICTYMDSQEGLDRLYDALVEIDRELRIGVSANVNSAIKQAYGIKNNISTLRSLSAPDIKYKNNGSTFDVSVGYDAKHELEELGHSSDKLGYNLNAQAIVKYSSSEVDRMEREIYPFESSEGKISADYVYVYPPGIPVIVPGELITKEAFDTVLEYKRMGFNIYGISNDGEKLFISVVKEGFMKKSLTEFFGNKRFVDTSRPEK